MMFFIRRGMPWAICQRLQRGWPYVTRRTSYSGGAWNPARPLGRGNDTPSEPGRATYTLTSDGLVHLDLVRADGSREQFIGPPVEPPEEFRRTRRMGAIPTLVYLSRGGIGFAIGFVLTDQHGGGNRVQNGILAALGGWVLAWLGLIITSAVGRARQQRAAKPHCATSVRPNGNAPNARGRSRSSRSHTHRGGLDGSAQHFLALRRWWWLALMRGRSSDLSRGRVRDPAGEGDRLTRDPSGLDQPARYGWHERAHRLRCGKLGKSLSRGVVSTRVRSWRR